MSKITELADAALPLDSTDLIEVVQNVSGTPVNKKVPVSELGGGGASALYQHREASGVNAGAGTSGGWYTRVLNSEQWNGIGASLASNQITLPAGTYRAVIRGHFYRSAGVQNRLRDVTNGVTLVASMPGWTGTGSDGTSFDAAGRGEFTLVTSVAVELQYQMTSNSFNANGLGYGPGFGEDVIHAEVYIEVVSA